MSFYSWVIVFLSFFFPFFLLRHQHKLHFSIDFFATTIRTSLVTLLHTELLPDCYLLSMSLCQLGQYKCVQCSSTGQHRHLLARDLPKLRSETPAKGVWTGPKSPSLVSDSACSALKLTWALVTLRNKGTLNQKYMYIILQVVGT